MRDTLVATVLRVYDQTSLLVSVNSVDYRSLESYTSEEVVTLKSDDSPLSNTRFNRLFHLLGQDVLLISEGKDEFGRIVARYKWIDG